MHRGLPELFFPARARACDRDPVTVADTNVEVLITVRLVVRVDSVDTQDPLLSLNTVSSTQSTPSPLLHAPLTLCVASPDLL